VLKGLDRLFLSADMQAKTFCDPKEFLRYARIHRPAVALIDVWMPLMTVWRFNRGSVSCPLQRASSSLRGKKYD
jgi:FixJ family two-component response regulator